MKTVLKQASHQRFVFRQRHHAVADIAGRQHAIFATQTAGAATIVGDGHNGGKVGDGPFRRSGVIALPHHMILQAA